MAANDEVSRQGKSLITHDLSSARIARVI